MRLPRLTLDQYHKGVYPTIQIALTVLAIIAAWRVLGVQQEATKRANQELEYRISKLDDFSKRLEQQQTRLEEQQKHLEETVRVSNSREATQLKTALELYQRSVEQYETAVNQDKHQTGYFADTNARFHNLVNQSISLIGHFPSKGPFYTPDEQALLQSMTAIETVQNELAVIFARHIAEYDATRERHYAERDATRERLRSDPESLDKQLQELKLINENLKQWDEQNERFQSNLENDMANPSERLKKLVAAQKQLLSRLDSAEKKRRGGTP